jgi:hypothetical protein
MYLVILLTCVVGTAESRSLLALGQEVGVFLIGNLQLAQINFIPQIRGQITIGILDSTEGSLDKVTQSSGLTTRAGKHIQDTSHVQQLLGDGSSDDTSTTGSGHQTYRHRTTLTSDL